MNVECDVLMSAGQNQQCQSLHKTFSCLIKHILLLRLKNWLEVKVNKEIIILAKFMLYAAVWAKKFLQPFANFPIFAAKVSA